MTAAKLAIFDCDGTLVDSEATIVAAMDACFAEGGLVPPGRAATRRIVGLSLPQAMAVLHPDGDAKAHHALSDGYKLCFQRMRAAGGVREPLYDGIVAVLDALEEDGWLLGIATGKSDRGLKLVLDAHGLTHRFVTCQTADRHPSKPHPAMIEAAMAEADAVPDATMMIGDTSYDMLMAKAAGVRAIGVAWGYHEPAELIAAGADAVARDPADLPRLAGVAAA